MFNAKLPLRGRIGFALILAFVALAVLPVGLLCFFALNRAEQQERSQSLAQLESVAELKKYEIGHWLEDQDVLDLILADPDTHAQIVAILQDDPQKAALLDSWRPILKAQLQAQKTFQEFFLYDAAGQILISTSELAEGKIVVEQPFFKPSLIAKDIQPPYYEVSTGEITMVETTQVKSDTGAVIGVLAGRLSLAELEKIASERTGLGNTGETYLVSLESNYLLTPSRFENYPMMRAYHSFGIDAALNHEDGAGIYEDYRGIRAYGVYRWIPELQSALLAEIDESEVLAALYQTRNQIITMAVVVVLLALAVGAGVTYRISQPIVTLTHVAEAIARGDYSQRADIRRRNEIGQLSAAVNTMADRLVQNITILDQRVQERTEQLLRSNEELRLEIAERTQAEEALRTSEEKYRGLIESTDAAIVMMDWDGRYLYFNRVAAEPFGASPESLVGKSAYDLWLPAEADRVVSEVRQVIEQNAGMRLEPQVTMDGKPVWFRASIQPMRDKAGKPFAALIYSADITEIKQAEEAIRRQNEILQQTHNFIGLADLNGRFIFINKGGADLVGVDNPESLIGKPILDWHSPGIGQRILDQFLPAALQTGQWHGENQLNMPDGRLVYVDQTIFPIRDKSGAVTQYAIIMTDITERRRAERLLQEAHELLEQRVVERTAELERTKNRLEAIFNHSADGVLLLDVDRGIQQANPAFDELFGLPEDGCLGRELTAFFDPDDAARMGSIIQGIVATHQTAHFEGQANHADGKRLDVEVSLAPVNRSDKAITSLVCIVRDVRDRKLYLQTIAEERNLLRTVIDAVPDFIYVKDLRHRMVLNNLAHARTLGAQDPTEVLGKTDYDFFPSSMAEKFYADEEQVFATGNPVLDTEDRFVGPGGREIWALTTKIPQRNLQREITGLVGITHDITERKQMEDALRSSEEKFRLFVESAPIATIISDLEGRIVLVNSATEKLFGYSRDELIGQFIEMLAPEEIRQTETAQRIAYLRQLEGRHMDFIRKTGQRRDGSVFPDAVQLSQINTPAGVMLMLNVIDITQQEQAEAALKQALVQEKELGDLKTRFVSTASHEFRTPLASIMATTDILTYYRDRFDKAQIDARLDKIRQQVNHLRDIMEDVLQLSRIQSGRVACKPVPGDLAALCGDIVEEFEGQPPYHGRIRYDCANPPVTLNFDVHLMRQVISNLVSNALKYSPADKPIHIVLAQDHEQVVLKVRDEGIGIPADDLQHLFEPFHRAANVGAISGTGLGLSITRQAVELHEGTIIPDSQIGVGTTFTVTLPRSPAKAVDPADL